MARKKAGCWFVSGDDLTGSAGRLSSSSSPIKAPVDLGEGCQASGQPSDDSTTMFSIRDDNNHTIHINQHDTSIT